MKTIYKILSLALVALMLTAGCNTMRGLGKDIEKGGKKIQKATD